MARRETYSATVTVNATDVIGVTWTGLQNFKLAQFEYHLTTAATEVGDTLDVYVDTTFNDGITWINIVHFAQSTGTSEPDRALAVVSPGASVMTAPTDIAADAAAGAVRHALGQQVRVRYTMAEAATTDNENFIFVVNAVFK